MYLILSSIVPCTVYQSWYQSEKGKQNTVDHKMEQCFTYKEKRQQHQLQQCESLMGPFRPHNLCWNLPILSIYLLMRPWPLVLGVWNTKSWGCACGPLIFKQNKRALIEQGIRKDTPTQGDKSGTGCCSLCLLANNCFRLLTHSYSAP